MNRRHIFAFAALAVSALMAQQVPPPKTHLKVGDMAPDFEMNSTLGGKVKLSDFRGKKNVVVAFYPAAFTGGCTKEMAGFQESLAKFEGTGAQILAISTDGTPSQAAFAKSLNVTFPMLSDFFDRAVSKEYGVLIPQAGRANRSTFVVDKDGKITSIEQGNTAVDVSGALSACSRLGH
jgi:mycoredoxin-dependent peroxiredoxin